MLPFDAIAVGRQLCDGFVITRLIRLYAQTGVAGITPVNVPLLMEQH